MAAAASQNLFPEFTSSACRFLLTGASIVGSSARHRFRAPLGLFALGKLAPGRLPRWRTACARRALSGRWLPGASRSCGGRGAGSRIPFPALRTRRMPILRAAHARGFAVACHRSVRRKEGRARRRPRAERIERGPPRRPATRDFGEYLNIKDFCYEHKQNLFAGAGGECLRPDASEGKLTSGQ